MVIKFDAKTSGRICHCIDSRVIKDEKLKLMTLTKFTGKVKKLSFIYIKFENILNRPIFYI